MSASAQLPEAHTVAALAGPTVHGMASAAAHKRRKQLQAWPGALLPSVAFWATDGRAAHSASVKQEHPTAQQETKPTRDAAQRRTPSSRCISSPSWPTRCAAFSILSSASSCCSNATYTACRMKLSDGFFFLIFPFLSPVLVFGHFMDLPWATTIACKQGWCMCCRQGFLVWRLALLL